MEVSNYRTCYFELTEGTTDKIVFLKFLMKLYSNLIPEEKERCLLIFDDARFHSTQEIIDFGLQKKLRIVTIAPYNSKLDMAELYFRHIKLYTYQESYNSIFEMQNRIYEIIHQITLENISKWFLSTLKVYKKFINDNRNINLNKLI